MDIMTISNIISVFTIDHSSVWFIHHYLSSSHEISFEILTKAICEVILSHIIILINTMKYVLFCILPKCILNTLKYVFNMYKIHKILNT